MKNNLKPRKIAEDHFQINNKQLQHWKTLLFSFVFSLFYSFFSLVDLNLNSRIWFLLLGFLNSHSWVRNCVNEWRGECMWEWIEIRKRMCVYYYIEQKLASFQLFSILFNPFSFPYFLSHPDPLYFSIVKMSFSYFLEAS